MLRIKNVTVDKLDDVLVIRTGEVLCMNILLV